MSNQLAIIDYGIGGLGLFLKIKKSHPEIGITYFSDAGEIPYGKLSQKQLLERVKLVIEYLKNQGIDTILVACHAASTICYLLNDDKVLDLIHYTQHCLDTEKTITSVGIIGGGRTIRSKKYSTHFKNQNLTVLQRIAQPLSIFIEKGETKTEAVQKELSRILQPIKKADALILACTHYPVLQKQIQDLMLTRCLIIDPVQFLYEQIQPNLHLFNKGADIFYTTGDPILMKEVTQKVYDLDIDTINHISI